MSDNTLYNIQVSNEGLVNIEYKSANGRKTKKLTDLDTLIAMFSSMKNTSETPVLPFGCRKIISTEKNEMIMIESQSKIVHEMKYGSQTFNDVMIPRSLWVFYVKKMNNGEKQIYKANIYTMDSLSPFSMNMPLYEWFLNNHGQGYYGICWGSNNITKIINGDISNYGSLISVYLNSVFNDHLPPVYTKLNDFKSLLPENERGNVPTGMPGFLHILQKVKMLPDRVLYRVNYTPQSIVSDFLTGRGNV